VLYSVSPDWFKYFLHMRSLLLVDSVDLRLSKQHILVRVIPSCFRFTKMYLCQVGTNFADKRWLLGIVLSRTQATEFVCLPGKSPVKV
jgi:hypothetical protein